MRWQNIREMLGWSRPPYGDEVKEVAPRPLSERETGWIRDILRTVPDWQNANFRETRVVAEGMNIEGYSIVLTSPAPENPRWKSSRDILGQLWIETEDRPTINIQLFQWKGQLQELYVLSRLKSNNHETPGGVDRGLTPCREWLVSGFGSCGG